MFASSGTSFRQKIEKLTNKFALNPVAKISLVEDATLRAETDAALTDAVVVFCDFRRGHFGAENMQYRPENIN